MIENQWYVICESKEITKKIKAMKRLNKNLVLYRGENGQISCFIDKCTHRSVELSKGNIVDGCIQCPFHGFKFNSTGECVEIPANGKKAKVSKRFNLQKFPIKEIDGFVFMYNGIKPKSEVQYFDELLDGFYSRGFNKVWKTHYSRAIENQLDVVHIPFVHKKTIGRQNKTLVNGPVVKWDEDKMTFYVLNEYDQGQKPLKPSEIMDYEKLFSLQFIMPNLWQNRISDQVRVLAAFAPIDEENTKIYLRFYQSFLTIPILRVMVNEAANLFNRRVLSEDYAVVRTQKPKNTQLANSEQLIQGDLPIGEYRLRVKKLKEKQNT